jgi:NAD(P)-dependent dehydrogenase (short-subunit alcohol dehydrogenase family)
MPALKKSAAPRVVSVSSGLAQWGRLELDNLQSERRYSPAGTYSMTKLANLLFMLELGRRAPWLLSVAAHPGATNTNLQVHSGMLSKLVMSFLGQSAAQGALPSLYAATGDVKTGDYFSPSLKFQMNGAPMACKLPKRALDLHSASALWDASEKLTNVRYDTDVPMARSA